MGEVFAPMLMSLGLFGLIGWGIWVGAEGRTRRERIKAVSEMQHKMLDKFGATGDLTHFLESEAGKTFLNTLKSAKRVPTARVVGSAQVGIVLLCLGIALLILGRAYRYDEPVLQMMGGIVLSLGLGFALSSVAALRLTKMMEREQAEHDYRDSNVA